MSKKFRPAGDYGLLKVSTLKVNKLDSEYPADTQAKFVDSKNSPYIF